MKLDCDFHIHSKYSGGTSKNMDFSTIPAQGVLKGLDIIGTGDALHSSWLKEIKKLHEFSDGIYEKDGCRFVVTTEVEDSRRVHHLILLPSASSAVALREALCKFSVDIDKDGRPHVRLVGEEIAEHVREVGGLIGPSHAFVPWTSIYKEYSSIEECYGRNTKEIKFIELGLSADTEMADYISELKDLSFLSNSDAHSPWPHRLGREFNRLEVNDATFAEIAGAIERKGSCKITLNVGFDPRLGKYHRTACINCFKMYSLNEASKLKWRCIECRGTLKKGVYDRVEELSSYKMPVHPEHRPQYIRIAPLAEILCLALKISNIYSQKVQDAWRTLVARFGSEIAVLIDVPVEDIGRESNEEIAKLIRAFRDGKFDIIEGGGGRYGRIIFNKRETEKQSVLDKFVM